MPKITITHMPGDNIADTLGEAWELAQRHQEVEVRPGSFAAPLLIEKDMPRALLDEWAASLGEMLETNDKIGAKDPRAGSFQPL